MHSAGSSTRMYERTHRCSPSIVRWDQTLLYVSQEGLSIHGSFDQHRSHDAGLTQPNDKRHRLPVSHRGIADQALAAWVPTVEPQHVSGDCRLVDKYEVVRIKKALLPNPASARAGDVGALPLCCLQTFFNGDAM